MTRILPLVAILALAACLPGGPAAASSEQAAPQAQPAGVLVEAAKPLPAKLPQEVARVNGEIISKADLEMAVEDLVARVGGQPIPDDQRDRVVRNVLDQLITYRLLLQEAIARKITVPEAEIDASIAEMRSGYPSEEAFNKALELRKITPATLRSDTREGIQIDTVIMNELSAKAGVTPEEVTEFYEKNPAAFRQGERVRASHILIRIPENADSTARDLARGRATEVLKEMKAGADFAALAKQYSEDPGSAPGGGDLGYFERGQMVGPFEEAAFSLAPTQTSDLVESTFGYHIILVADKREPRTMSLADARPQIQKYLEGRRHEEQTEAFVISLKAKGNVEIYI